MIPTKPSGYSVPDALSEWSVKFWAGSLSDDIIPGLSWAADFFGILGAALFLVAGLSTLTSECGNSNRLARS